VDYGAKERTLAQQAAEEAAAAAAGMSFSSLLTWLALTFG